MSYAFSAWCSPFSKKPCSCRFYAYGMERLSWKVPWRGRTFWGGRRAPRWTRMSRWAFRRGWWARRTSGCGYRPRRLLIGRRWPMSRMERNGTWCMRSSRRTTCTSTSVWRRFFAIWAKPMRSVIEKRYVLCQTVQMQSEKLSLRGEMKQKFEECMRGSVWNIKGKYGKCKFMKKKRKIFVLLDKFWVLCMLHVLLLCSCADWAGTWRCPIYWMGSWRRRLVPPTRTVWTSGFAVSAPRPSRNNCVFTPRRAATIWVRQKHLDHKKFAKLAFCLLWKGMMQRIHANTENFFTVMKKRLNFCRLFIIQGRFLKISINQSINQSISQSKKKINWTCDQSSNQSSCSY